MSIAKDKLPKPKTENGRRRKKTPTEPPVPESSSWEDDGYRVLIAPKSKSTMFRTRWTTEMSTDGTAVPKREDIPIVLKSHTAEDRALLGYADYNPDTEEPTYDPLEVEKLFASDVVHGTEYDPDTYQDLTSKFTGKRMALWGCSIRLDVGFAEECGYKDCDKKGSAFKQMVDSFTKDRLYGKHFAFVDDAEGIKGLLPAFSSFVRAKEQGEEASYDILAQGAVAQIGPELGVLEPETAPYDSDGK